MDSGLYQIVHSLHRPNEQLTFKQRERFPQCAVCKSEVRYLLLVHAAPIFDEDAA